MPIDQSLALARLLQLASPALPVGAYGYSQGLERAVEDRLVYDPESAKAWIGGILVHSQARLDLPILARIVDASMRADRAALVHWNCRLLACRETRELRDEDIHLGQALTRLLDGLGLEPVDIPDRPCFALPFGFAATRWQIPKNAALGGYLWAWLENQVLAAIKLVPLGQLAGQRILFELAARLPDCIEGALSMRDDEIGAALPCLAIESSRHENQYTRLFRS